MVVNRSFSIRLLCAAFAIRLAIAGAHVCIAGRSAADAEKVLQEMRAVAASATQRFTFLQCDTGTVQGCVDAARAYRASHDRLDILAFTVGILGTDDRVETADGVEREFQLSFFGRFCVFRELEDLMSASVRGSTTWKARVINIATAGACVGARGNMQRRGTGRQRERGEVLPRVCRGLPAACTWHGNSASCRIVNLDHELLPCGVV